MSSNQSPTFDPLNALDYALNHWIWIVALTLLGTCLGWAFSQLNPARYEARAQITLRLDLSRTGTPSEDELEMAINAVGTILDSPTVRHELVTDAQNSDFSLDATLLSERAFVERKNQSYVLRVQWEDPQQAAWLVNRWSMLAVAELKAAEYHALSAELLQRRLDSLSSCLAESIAEPPAPALCPSNLQQLQLEIQQTGQLLLDEQKAARGFFPGLSTIPPEPAEIPAHPIQFERRILVVAGCLLGLLLAIFLLSFQIPNRLKLHRSRREMD